MSTSVSLHVCVIVFVSVHICVDVCLSVCVWVSPDVCACDFSYVFLFTCFCYCRVSVRVSGTMLHSARSSSVLDLRLFILSFYFCANSVMTALGVGWSVNVCVCLYCNRTTVYTNDIVCRWYPACYGNLKFAFSNNVVLCLLVVFAMAMLAQSQPPTFGVFSLNFSLLFRLIDASEPPHSLQNIG